MLPARGLGHLRGHCWNFDDGTVAVRRRRRRVDITLGYHVNVTFRQARWRPCIADFIELVGPMLLPYPLRRFGERDPSTCRSYPLKLDAVTGSSPTCFGAGWE